MYLQLFSLASKVIKRRSDEKEAPYDAKPNYRKSSKARLAAVFPLLLTMISFILAFICVFAGNKPGEMEQYAIFTLNTSRIGENIRQELDNKINNFNFKRDAPPLEQLAPTTTAVPTTMITLAPRFNPDSALHSAASDIKSKATSLDSEAHSKASSVESDVHSKITSAESAAKAEATKALNGAKSEIVHVVNQAFNEIISGLEFKDFYSVHVRTTCEGEYVTPDGQNITVGKGALPPKGTKKLVDSCSGHSAIDPLSFLQVFYWVGIVLTAIALLLAFVGVFSASVKMGVINIIALMPAFCVMALASALAHGIAVGVPKLIDFLGEDIGIDGQTGNKFLTLTWAMTILLFASMVHWGIVIWVARRYDKMAENGVVGSESYQMRATQQSQTPKYGY